MNTAELITHTGLNFRRLDYWARNGVIPETAHGCGSRRDWDPELIPALRIIRELSDAFPNGHPTTELFKHIVENFDEGCVRLGPNIKIIWETSP